MGEVGYGKPPKSGQIKKGEVRNPAGMPKGYKQSKTILAKILKGKMTIEEGGKILKKSRQEVALMRLVITAIDPKVSSADQIRAIGMIMDRMDGKAYQPLTGPEGIPLEPPVFIVNPVKPIINENE